MSKSAEIRRLSSEGYTKSQISKMLDIRFQFVYNVLRRDEDKKILDSVKKSEETK